MSDVVRCPFCHEPFPVEREACPHCGSDVETGWRDPGGGIALGRAMLPDAGTHPAAAVRSLRAYRASRARRRRLIWIALALAAAGLGGVFHALWA